jgi:hypothetical protein
MKKEDFLLGQAAVTRQFRSRFRIANAGFLCAMLIWILVVILYPVSPFVSESFAWPMIIALYVLVFAGWRTLHRLKRQFGLVCPACQRPLRLTESAREKLFASGACGRCGARVLDDAAPKV